MGSAGAWVAFASRSHVAARSQSNRTDSRVRRCIASEARDCYPCVEGAPKRKKCTGVVIVEGDGDAEVVVVVVERKKRSHAVDRLRLPRDVDDNLERTEGCNELSELSWFTI